jgi:hypothetical protein
MHIPALRRARHLRTWLQVLRRATLVELPALLLRSVCECSSRVPIR